MHRIAPGFTLLELTVATAVLGIMLGIGVPAFSTLRERAQVTRTLHLATTALATARIEAIRRNRPVSVCPSANGRSCRTDLVWDNGWIVFVDSTRSGRPRSSSDVLETMEGRSGELAVRSTTGRQLIRFTPNGWSAGSNVTLRLCTRQGRQVAQLIVSNAGRVRTERLAAKPPCPFDA